MSDAAKVNQAPLVSDIFTFSLLKEPGRKDEAGNYKHPVPNGTLKALVVTESV